MQLIDWICPCRLSQATAILTESSFSTQILDSFSDYSKAWMFGSFQYPLYQASNAYFHLWILWWQRAPRAEYLSSFFITYIPIRNWSVYIWSNDRTIQIHCFHCCNREYYRAVISILRKRKFSSVLLEVSGSKCHVCKFRRDNHVRIYYSCW
jgi:hypothetical protein